jgi:hypothetical protein
MRKLYNKKGADKIISVYWFAILFIVAAAIVYMAAVFYGSPYDVRELESKVLNDKIAGCLSVNGNINGNWENLNQENFLQECNLNFNAEDAYGWKNDQYYVGVRVLDFNSNNELKSIGVGNVNLKDFCTIEGEQIPGCIIKEIYAFDEDNGEYRIEIISIIRKTEKNV